MMKDRLCCIVINLVLISLDHNVTLALVNFFHKVSLLVNRKKMKVKVELHILLASLKMN